jgi:ATP-dependent Lon protease
VHDVILPSENRSNVAEDLTPEQLEGLSIHYVSTIEEALAIALPTTEDEARSDEREREAALTQVPA